MKNIVDGTVHQLDVIIQRNQEMNSSDGFSQPPKWECKIKIDEPQEELKVDANNVIYNVN